MSNDSERDSLLHAVASAPPIPPPERYSSAVVMKLRDSADLARARSVLSPFDPIVRDVFDGVVLVAARPQIDVADRATRAAVIALAVRGVCPDARIAVVSDWSETRLVERGATIVSNDSAAEPRIVLDEATAAKLPPRFDVKVHSSCYVLVGDRGVPTSRPVGYTDRGPADLDPVTLTFTDPALESAFLLQMGQDGRVSLRTSARATIFILLAGLAFDYLVVGERRWLRFYPAFFAPTLALLAFTWLPPRIVIRFRLVAAAAYVYCFAVVSLWSQVAWPAIATPRIFGIWMISAIGTIPRYGLRVVHGPLLWPVFIAYALLTTVFVPIPQGAAYAFMLAVGALFGLVIAYQLELSRRRLFVERLKTERLQREAHERDVKVLNDEVRRQVADRAARLSNALARLDADRPPVALRVLQPGQVIEERYRVVRAIGKGGMGAVYEVERVTDERRLALKVLTGSADSAALARFAREAHVAAELEHPNVVTVWDVDVTRSGMLFFVMELVVGGSLADYRSSYGDTRWALPVLVQVARALAAMHQRGIVHRDLKPSNILLDGTTVKVADFGLVGVMHEPEIAVVVSADAATQAAGPELTRTGAIMGTPLYMAPELASGARHAGSSSDVFSFGVLAYDVLANELPFASPPALERISGRPAPSLKPLAQAKPAIPVHLGALIDQCLAMEPEARPTADAIVGALEKDTDER